VAVLLSQAAIVVGAGCENNRPADDPNIPNAAIFRKWRRVVTVRTTFVYSIQSLYANVLVANGAARIMPLQGESTLTELTLEFSRLRAGRFDVFDDFFAINQHRDRVPLDDDFLRPPFVILRGGQPNVDDTPKTAGFDPIAMRDVYLRFEPTLGPTGSLILGVKVYSAIGVWFGHYFRFEVKILEWFVIANVEKVAAVTVSDKSAILDLPSVAIFLGHLPAVERLAVHERFETRLNLGDRELGRGENRSYYESIEEISFHAQNLCDSREHAKRKGALCFLRFVVSRELYCTDRLRSYGFIAPVSNRPVDVSLVVLADLSGELIRAYG